MAGCLLVYYNLSFHIEQTFYGKPHKKTLAIRFRWWFSCYWFVAI